MKPFQERVFAEQSDLAIKLNKLRIFKQSELFKSLPSEEQLRLEMQERAMSIYLYILGERITAFT